MPFEGALAPLGSATLVPSQLEDLNGRHRWSGAGHARITERGPLPGSLLALRRAESGIVDRGAESDSEHGLRDSHGHSTSLSDCYRCPQSAQFKFSPSPKSDHPRPLA